MKFRKAAKSGLTLIELVIVMAILGVLAAMLLPKFEGLTNAANEAAASSSAVDAAKLIGQYKAVKTVYPDRWDSLTDGTNLWTGGSVATATKGLNSELVSIGTASATADKLTTGTLTAAQVTALQKVGITTMLTLTSASVSGSTRPGDCFTTVASIAASTPVAIVNSGSSGGKKIIDHVYRVNLSSVGTSGTLNPDPVTGIASTTTPTTLVVFGLGPQNAMIPNSMMEAPTYGNAEAQYIYNRLLVVFEVTNPTSTTTNAKATFKTILGADGDLLDDMSQRLQNGATL